MEMSSNEEGQSFIVSWSNHHRSLGALFENYYLDETFADCSLAVGAKEITAHKIILSACSPFFNTILRRHREKHPVIVIEHALHEDLLAIVEYMYKGEVNVPKAQLPRFLELADSLQIAGLVTAGDETLEEVPVKSKRTWDEANVEEEVEEKPVVEEGQLDTVEYLMDEVETGDMMKESNSFNLLTEDDEQEDVKPPLILKPNLSRPSGRGNKSKAEDANKELRMHNDCRVKCNDCGGLYKSEQSYANHYRYDCNNVHICSSCAKVFKNKRHLLDHVRDDCGRFHVCKNCERQFTQKVNLTTHQKHYCRPGENKNGKPPRSRAAFSYTIS